MFARRHFWRGQCRQAFLAFLLLIAGAGCVAEPLPGPAGAPSGSDSAQQWWVPITGPSAVGSPVALLETMVYRPNGDGPFPLVVINHGKPRDRSAVRAMHPGYTLAAQWFVARGFAVAVAMRRGYGASQGDISDSAGSCDDRDYFATARLTAAEIEGVIAYMQRQSFVDSRNVVVVGQSWGGLGALGVAYDAPPGVVGIVNFAGGGGSFAPGQICSGENRLIADVGRLGGGDRIPEIWLYAENDHFFAPPLAHSMYAAYRAVAHAPVTFVDLPAFGDDGHQTFARGDPAIWGPAVDKFLSGLPGGRRGAVP